jgi:prepilin-type N-terminal cleavage/methylation domain-containing protein
MRRLEGSMRKIGSFTLVELLAVVAIISVLAVIALPQFQSYRQRAMDKVALQNIRDIITAAGAVDAENSPEGSEWLPRGMSTIFPEVAIAENVNIWIWSYNMGAGSGAGVIAYSCHTNGTTGYALFSPYTEDTINWWIDANIIDSDEGYRFLCI